MPKLTESEVIGHFKSTGSRDPDVLAAKRAQLIDALKSQKFLAAMMMGMGVLLTLTVIAAILGIPVFLYGLWMHRACKKHIALVETVFARLTSSVPSQPAAAGAALPQASM